MRITFVLVYKTANNKDIPLLVADMKNFGNKAKGMIENIMETRKHLVVSDLEQLKQKNLRDEEDLMGTPVAMSAGYCQQEQDAPPGSLYSRNISDLRHIRLVNDVKKIRNICLI
jgi:hypothetical protein